MARLDTAKLPVSARVGVGAAALIIIGVAYYVMLYSDVENAISAASRQEQVYRGELAEARKAEFDFQKDLAELSERQQRQREFNKILPVDAESPAFLATLQSVASVTGVGLNAWTPNGEVQEKFYARIPMKLELTGRFHQLAKFFYSVGQVDRIINMENISIIQPKVQGEDVVVKAEALATAFRTLDDTKVNAAAAEDKRGAAKAGGT